MRHLVYALAEGTAVRYVGYTAASIWRRRKHRRAHPQWAFLVVGAYPTREDGIEHERWWIRRLRTAGHPLTNINDGGGGPATGIKRSEETKQKMSEALRGRHFTVPPFTAEHRARLSEAMKGNKNGVGHVPSAEAREKMSHNRLGRTT